jgi:hypothetical protein
VAFLDFLDIFSTTEEGVLEAEVLDNKAFMWLKKYLPLLWEALS